MLSKKMTFSLMSLITIFALAFVVSPAMAGTFTTDLSGDGTIHAGQDLDVTIKFGAVVSEAAVQGVAITVTVVKDDFSSATYTVKGDEASAGAGVAILVTDPVNTNALSGFGPVMQKDIDLARVGDQFDGKTFVFTIPVAQLPQAVFTGGAQTTAGATRIYVSIPADIPTLDPANVDTSVADTLALDLRPLSATLDIDTPRVVSVQRLRPGSQLVVAAFQEERVTGAFDVRIVLTEAHPNLKDGMKVADIKKYINIDKGEPSNLRLGVPFSRIGETLTDPLPSTLTTTEFRQIASTVRPHPTEGMYWHDAAPTFELQGVPRPALDNAPADDDADDAAAENQLIPLATGNDNKYHQYRLTITPHAIKGDPALTFDVKIKVNSFDNGGAPVRLTYVTPDFGDSVRLPNGRGILTVAVSFTKIDRDAGYRVHLADAIVIPAGGYLVITKESGYTDASDGAEIVVPNDGDAVHPEDEATTAPDAVYRTPIEMLYNVKEQGNLPNLATAFLNGVVLDLENGGANLAISEVMWGEDVSLVDRTHSQYIELYNSSSSAFKTPVDKPETPEIDERTTLIFYAPNEFTSVPAKVAVAATATTPATMALPDRVSDRVGTLDATGAYWSPTSKGQSGSSGIPLERETTADVGIDLEVTIARTGITPIVSMYRVMVPSTTVGATGMMLADGQMAASWMSSAGPKSANFKPLAIGIRHGTPGAATDATSTPADTAAEAKAKADTAAAALKKTASTGTMPEDGQIYISEIMFAGGGIFPQWIEISNGSRTEEINLSGWTLTVDNAAADADVSIGASAKFTISDGTTIDMSGQQKTPSTILVVTEAGRNNVDGSGQVLDLMKSNEVDLILAGVVTRKYTLLSGMAFMVTLAPPEPEATKPPADETVGAKATRQAAEKKAAAKRKAATDRVGNLGADGAAAWALPMSEDGRSSIIRRHVQVAIGAAAPDDGTLMDSWVLASETSFAAPTHIRAQSYYGAANDVGTPGFRAGGALPVELSHFRPARDKVTGAVVITWSTQSELNNAGFFIKRSQQRDGEFKVINATMIQGAGTSSEKQFYTYNDTTAQPNVVYYYQIEDVSLDGNRQTLTNGIRLKGHVSVAGKLTTLWGDLKTSQ